jgi:hypothetical protein
MRMEISLFLWKLSSQTCLHYCCSSTIVELSVCVCVVAHLFLFVLITQLGLIPSSWWCRWGNTDFWNRANSCQWKYWYEWICRQWIVDQCRTCVLLCWMLQHTGAMGAQRRHMLSKEPSPQIKFEWVEILYYDLPAILSRFSCILLCTHCWSQADEISQWAVGHVGSSLIFVREKKVIVQTLCWKE